MNVVIAPEKCLYYETDTFIYFLKPKIPKSVSKFLKRTNNSIWMFQIISGNNGPILILK